MSSTPLPIEISSSQRQSEIGADGSSKSKQSSIQSGKRESQRSDVSTRSTQGRGVRLVEDKFGAFVDPDTNKLSIVKRYTWTNENNVRVEAISFGATITRIEVPDGDGKSEDIVMGFDTMAGYTQDENPNIGCSVGRVANRIGHAKFTLNGKDYEVDKNVGGVHHLHGGHVGWARKLWQGSIDGTKVRMTLVSKDGDGGYPGDVLATATFYLTADNQFFIEYQAISSKATIVNLTSHSYFNLAGHAAGSDELYKHIMTINADKITVTDQNYIPNGQFQCVGGSVYDFRTPREIGPALARVKCNGFDDNFCVQKGSQQGLAFIARAFHPMSGRFLEIYSNQPGVQFYTANSMPNQDGKINPMRSFEQTPEYRHSMLEQSEVEVVTMEMDGGKSDCDDTANEMDMPPLHGKGGAQYTKHGAFCLETQNYPDAVNHSNFPSPVLLPGETYFNQTILQFGATKKC